MTTDNKTARKPKQPPTPRQAEIKRLTDKGRDKRTDQENARLDQLRKEERRERFLRLAPKRTQKALATMDNIVLCANANAYDYTADEADKIVKALLHAAAKVEAAFSKRKEEKSLFSL